jgi:hypothetical protein
MVRDMMDGEGNVDRLALQLQQQLPEVLGSRKPTEPAINTSLDGNVVQGANTTTYVGATHCMAMLEDVSYPAYHCCTTADRMFRSRSSKNTSTILRMRMRETRLQAPQRIPKTGLSCLAVHLWIEINCYASFPKSKSWTD